MIMGPNYRKQMADRLRSAAILATQLANKLEKGDVIHADDAIDIVEDITTDIKHVEDALNNAR